MTDVERANRALRELELRRPEHPALRQELLEAKEEVAVQEERLRCFDFKAYTDRTHAERDKAERLLAWLANPTRRGNTIIEIADQAGRSLYRQDEINARFRDYYQRLYKSSVPRKAGEMEEYLWNSHSIPYQVRIQTN